MSSNPIIGFVLRGLQILFSVVVLGLSVSLIKGQQWGSLPATLGFAAFVGGVSLLGAFVGLAATWVQFFQSYLGMLIDGVIMLINLAGGVILAVKLKGINCANNDDRYKFDHMLPNDLLNGGCADFGDDTICWNQSDSRWKNLNSRCKMNQADSVFMFFTVIVLIASATMTFLRMKRGY